MRSDDRNSLRARWRAAKVEAQKRNNGRDIDLKVGGKSWDLGPALDRWESALERYDASMPGDAARLQALSDMEQANIDARRALAAYDSWLQANPVALRDVNSEARGELSAAIAVINASINNDIVRTKVPEPWKPDPQKIDTDDPTALEADWEAEVDSMQEWDPTIGEDPTQSRDPGRLA